MLLSAAIAFKELKSACNCPQPSPDQASPGGQASPKGAPKKAASKSTGQSAESKASPSPQGAPQGQPSQPGKPQSSLNPLGQAKPTSPPPPAPGQSPDSLGAPQPQDPNDPNAQNPNQHDGIDQVLQALGFALEVLKSDGSASYFKEGNGVTTSPSGSWQHFENGQPMAKGAGEATLASYLSSKPGMNPKSELHDPIKNQPQFQQGPPMPGGPGQQPGGKPGGFPPKRPGAFGASGIKAGGPGSGRHPEAGQFKRWASDTSRGKKGVRYTTHYKAPSGANVAVTREKAAEGPGLNKSTAAGESFTVHLGTASDFGRKTFGGDRSGALDYLSSKFGINHKV